MTIQEDLEKAIESAKNALDACKVQGKEGTASSLAVIISELEKVRDHVTETEHYFSLPHENPICSRHGEVDLNHRCNVFVGMVFDYLSYRERFG